MMTTPSKKVVFRGMFILFINLIFLCIGIIILELVYGTWFEASKLNRINIPRNFHETYSVNSLYATDHPLINYDRDLYGFRGNYPDPTHIDILTLGGSTTDQIYIDLKETWQEILAKKFLENGKNISVVNSGLDGLSTYGHVASFDYWYPSIPNFHARYFLFYIGTNDFITNPLLQNKKYLDSTTTNNPIELIKQNSAIYWLTVKLFGMYAARNIAKVNHGFVDFSYTEWTDKGKMDMSEYEPEMKDHLLAYHERLKYIFTKVRELNGTLICVTPGSRRYKIVNNQVFGIVNTQAYKAHLINGVDYYHMMRLLHTATLDECQKAGGITFDADKEIDWQNEDFYDVTHNTPHGTKKIGEYLYFKLKDTIQK
jgi:hypothetical protein